MPRTKKTGRQLDQEIADAVTGLDRKIASARIEGGELYWRGRRGSPVAKPHKKTTASCKTCGRFHSTKEHERHAGTGAKPRPTRAKKVREARGSARKRRVETPTRRDPADVVTEAVLSAPASDRFGDRKVFISRIWDKTKGELQMTLNEFKRWLVDAYMAGRLEMSRADLVAAMDPEVVAASSTRPEGQSYPEWHFVVDPSR